MQSVSARIWTRVAVSISYTDNHGHLLTPRAPPVSYLYLYLIERRLVKSLQYFGTCQCRGNWYANILYIVSYICCVKGEVVVDHSTETRWFKKFRLGCKNLDDQVSSVRPKTVDYDP